MSRPAEGYEQKAPSEIIISNVLHDTFSLCATLQGVEVNFLFHTGAAVSLLHSMCGIDYQIYLWSLGQTAFRWVDGSTFLVLGSAGVYSANISIPSHVIVMENLTTEGILKLASISFNEISV